MVRFYPNRPEFRFHGAVHEQVYEHDQPAAFQPIQLEIIHNGYEQEEYQRKRKEERYLRLYGKRLEDDPHDSYMLYQMGKLLASLKRWQAAEPYLRDSLRWGEPERLYYPVMLVLLGYVLREQGKSAESAALLAPYQASYNDFPDLFFLLGLLAMDAGQMDKIEHYFTEALKIGDTDKYTSVCGVGTYKAAYNLGVYYEVAGNADLASQCYGFAAQYGYEPAIGRLNS